MAQIVRLLTFSLLSAAAAGGLTSCRDSAAGPAHEPLTREVPAIVEQEPVLDVAEGSATEVRPTPDDLHRERLVGVWKQHETGVRWLRVRPDGTGRMFIDPDWIAKAVIGSGLTMEIEWSVADGRARMKSVSGTPSAAFKAVSTLYGRDRDRPIVALTDEKFVMLDESDGSTSEWTRVPPNEPLPKALHE
jgi:hypothetical protein